jgi:hypothetical protein
MAIPLMRAPCTPYTLMWPHTYNKPLKQPPSAQPAL